MIARSLIERYRREASPLVANRARLLEACGERQISRTWDLICREINKLESNLPRRHDRSSNEELYPKYPLLERASREAVARTDQSENKSSTVRREPGSEPKARSEKIEKTKTISSPLPVFLTKNDELFRETLKQLLSNSPFKIAGEVLDFRELNSVQSLVPDGSIILLDYPGALDGATEELEIVRTRFSAARLVVLTSLEDQTSFKDCVMAGVDGYLVKKISGLALIEALHLIALGEKVFPSGLANRTFGSDANRESSAGHRQYRQIVRNK